MAVASCFSMVSTHVHVKAVPPSLDSIGPWARASSCRLSMTTSCSLEASHSCSWNSGLTPTLSRKRLFRLSSSLTQQETPLASETSEEAFQVSDQLSEESSPVQEEKTEEALEVSDQLSEESSPVQEEKTEEDADGQDTESYPVGTKVYVGNLPYTCDSAELAGIIQEWGSVEMVEVIYDRTTGRSRGFAFVTMSTVEDANAVIENLDGSEFGGRTLRVNFPDKPRTRTYNSNFVDSQHKVFVGNLAWGVNAETLTEVFSKHGNLLGAKVLYDPETGRSRGYGFVSYASQSEVEAAVASLDGMELEGRAMRVNVALGRRSEV